MPLLYSIQFTNMISVSPVTPSKGDTFSVVIDYKTERNFLKLQIRTDQTSATAIKGMLPGLVQGADNCSRISTHKCGCTFL